MHTIEAEHLTRDYGGGRGVFDLSLSVAEGEAFGFLGPNGAGKTTVIRHLMGFLRPQSGRCRMGAWDCWAQREQVQGMVGYVPGEIAFFEDMRGTDFLRFVEDYRGVSGASRREALLERLELDPRVAIRKMSKGNKQKLAITAALLHDPQVLILDEPTSGLDPLMQSRFVELIREEKRRKSPLRVQSTRIFKLFRKFKNTHSVAKRLFRHAGGAASAPSAQLSGDAVLGGGGGGLCPGFLRRPDGPRGHRGGKGQAGGYLHALLRR